MHIVIDSNIIIQDFRLKGSEAILFLNNYSYNDVKCFISKVTYLEILKNFEKQLEQKIGKVKQQLNSLKRQTDEVPFDFNESFVSIEVEKYKEYLDARLKEYKIKIQPLPRISHHKILDHILDEKPPFEGSDSGYKDFLIFHSILEIIEKYNTGVVFISNDNDFGEKSIHFELEELNQSKNPITLRKSLKEINQNELKENINRSNAQLTFITEIFEDSNHESDYIESVVDFINSRIFLEIFPIHLAKYEDIIIDGPYLDYRVFYSDTGIINNVNAVSKDLLIVNAELDAFISYSFSINQKDLRIFRNLPEEIQFEYNIEDNRALIWIGGYFRINTTVQSDKSGLDIKKVELCIKEVEYF